MVSDDDAVEVPVVEAEAVPVQDPAEPLAPVAAAPEPEPAPLRLDGPTLEEYVAAGYKAWGYPPKGYASVPSRTDAPVREPVVSRADAFAEKSKQAVRDAISAQPFRGSPEFDDLKVVADAIIDALADEMRG